MTNTTDLEDRVLVLQDKVDTLNKAFDPNEPRDKDGKWTSGGGGASGSPLKGAVSWLSQARVAQAAKAGDYSARARDLLAATAATIITTYNNDDNATEAVKTALLELSTGLKVSAHEARERVSTTLNRLRVMRAREKKPDVAKAGDPVLELLTKIIEALDALELGDG